MTEDQRDEVRRRVAAEREAQGLGPTVAPDSDALAVLAAVAAKVADR